MPSYELVRKIVELEIIIENQQAQINEMQQEIFPDRFKKKK